MEKRCLKWRTRGVSQSFLYIKNIWHRGDHSTTITKKVYFFSTMATKQSWSLFYVEERRSIFLAVPCNTLVILKMKTIGFLFKHIFYSFNIRCNCFMFMSNIFCFIILRLSAFDFIAYFFYSTKCNILEQPCLVCQKYFHMFYGNIRSQIGHVKSASNWHDFVCQIHGFLHTVQKGEVWINSHNPLWRSVVYRRKKINAASLWSFQ